MAKIKCVCIRCQIRFEVSAYSEINEIGKSFCHCSKSLFRIVKVCENCKCEFFIYPAWDKKTNYTTCSKECRDYLNSLCHVKKRCSNCGKIIKKRRSDIKNNRNSFCSQKCKSEFETERIKCKCSNCDTIFYKRPSEIKRGGGDFCSWKCKVTPKKLIIREDHALVPLNHGKYAIIDLEDVEKVGNYNWRSKKGRNTFYAVRTDHVEEKITIVSLHRFILNLNENDEIMVDHWDNNGLNCKRRNLRTCNNAQNCRNRLPLKNGTSKYKGVFLRKDNGKFVASISINGNSLYLGVFNSEIKAAKVYDRMAIKLFKDFAYTNFPKENYI